LPPEVIFAAAIKPSDTRNSMDPPVDRLPDQAPSYAVAALSVGV